MLNKITYFFILFTSIVYAQSITVDDVTYSATDLAELLLDGSCIDPTNVSYSDAQSVAYFNQNGSVFPIPEGIIIRTGIANLTAGPYTDADLSSQVNSNGDAYLEGISTSTGQAATITDTAFLEFDFVPISSDFNFNFVFASNEYGQWQCGFSDVFAFQLTDLVTNVTTNLAVVPTTTIPVSVATIRDNAYNTGCTSENPSLFSTYNVGNAGVSTLNMRGHTEVLNASAMLTINNPYRIRLVIGDYNNPDFDSAVLIESGSFTTPLDIGADATLCAGNSMNVTTDLDTTEFTHSWTHNGNPYAGNVNNISITQAGTYIVTAVKGSCTLTDEIVITDLSTNMPNDISVCDDGSGSFTYDLSINDETVLGVDPLIYDVVYFANQANIPNTPIVAPNITNYSSAGNETIYIKLFNIQTNTYCDLELSFDLLLDAGVTATQPSDIQLCDLPNATATLTDQDVAVLNGLNPANYSIFYYLNQSDAQANNTTNAITTLGVSLATSPQTVWVTLANNSNLTCFDVTSFQVIVNPLPPVSTIPDVIECTEFTLPVITNGNYYDAPGGPTGTGAMLNEGDVILDAGTYYIYNGPDANGCFNESSFVLTFIDEYSVQEDHCEQFIVPTPPAGAFYTAIDGPSGTGTLIPPGSIFTSSFDLYYYAEINGVVCKNEPFPITVYALPPVDTLADITECVQTTLPSLTNGGYFTDSSGVTPLPSNTLTTSQTVFIVNTETHNAGMPNEITCSDFTSFEVIIINTITDVTACGSYTLPALTTGDYFTGPAGTGTQIPVGTVIDTVGANDIYIFAPTSTAPNCTDNLQFTVTIIENPPVDTITPPTNLFCLDNPYVLPSLTDGTYYDAPNGPNGTGTQLNPGDMITTLGNTTVYVYNQVNWGVNPGEFCFSETSFTIETRDLPPVDNYTDVYSCDPYTLQPLTNGVYYDAPDGPNGTGSVIPAGTIIDTTQTIYIYNQWTDLSTCISETVITVFILGVDVGTYSNISECDSYTLPPLDTSVVDMHYYSASGGNPADEILPADFTYNNLGTYTVYVYADNGDRFVCIDEEEFTITISETPILPNFPDVAGCNTFTLPPLDNTNYNVAYYSDSGGNPADIIDISNPITTIGSQMIYVYATAFDNVTCFDEASFELEIIDIEVDVFQDVIVCDSYTLPTLDTTSVNQAYYSAPGGYVADEITNLTLTSLGTQTVYVYAAVLSPIFCENESSFTVTINNSPILPPLPDQEACVSYTLPVLNTASYNAAYYTAPGGNSADEIDASNYTITNEGVNTIYVYASNTTDPNCFTETSFTVTIYPLLDLNIADGVICVDLETGETTQSVLLQSNLPNGGNGFIVNWYFGGNLVHTGQDYLADAVGTYTVETIKTTPDIPPLCNYNTTTVEVTQSSVATATVSVSADFEDAGVLVVHLTGGYGEYEYQLNDGPFQTSNEFTNVHNGDHVITVRDVSSGDCGSITLDATVIMYPKFFTPNGDGINETWNIFDLDNQPEAEIFIFDRFGKFIKQIYPSGNGWDGLYNGRPLPATDYWFKVLYKGRNGEDKEFRAHFSLKR